MPVRWTVTLGEHRDWAVVEQLGFGHLTLPGTMQQTRDRGQSNSDSPLLHQSFHRKGQPNRVPHRSDAPNRLFGFHLPTGVPITLVKYLE